MHRNAVIIFALSLVLCTCGRRQPQPVGVTGEKRLPTTPVKDQGESHLGSLYAMLATIETEHLMRGDSVNLSTAYLVRAWARENALRHYLSRGDASQDARCTAATAIHLLHAYGVYPYDSYVGATGFQQSVLERKLKTVTDAAIVHRVGLEVLSSRLEEVLDRAMGYLPGGNVHFLGVDYTPTEFARSVCAPDEYLCLVSYSRLPYGKVTTATPDIGGSTLVGYVETRNLPLDSLVTHVRRALEEGHPVCWEGDTTNQDFIQRKGSWVTTTTVSSNGKELQVMRQRAYENFSLTLDHAFAIVGVVRRGEETYFRCKNSQGSGWGNAGYVYLSESYLRKYTMAVAMTHNAFL